MSQYQSVNVKLSNSPLDRLKQARKCETGVILRLLSNMIGNPNDESNFPIQLLLTNRQASKRRKVFENGLSANIIISKNKNKKLFQR